MQHGLRHVVEHDGAGPGIMATRNGIDDLVKNFEQHVDADLPLDRKPDDRRHPVEQGAVEPVLQPAPPARRIQLAERLRLDLPDAFPGQAERYRDFFQRRLRHADAETAVSAPAPSRGFRMPSRRLS